MKIKLALIALFSFLSVFVLAVEYSVADETFSIVKIEKDAGGKKVTVFLDHDVSYSTLAAWPGSRGPKIIPRVNHSWDFSFLRRDKLTLKGDFKFGQKYTIIFPKNFKLDEKTYRKSVNSFAFESPSFIDYWNHKTVIERQGPKYLHLKIANTEKILYREINISPALLSSAINATIGDRNADWDILSRAFSSNQPQITSDLKPFESLFRGQSARNKLFNVQKKIKSRLFSLPLEENGVKGEGSIKLIRLSTEGEDKNTKTPIRLIRVTDLGITLKQANDDMLVWVTSLKEATPIEGVEIFGLTGLNSIFKLGGTGADGVLKFSSQVSQGITLGLVGYESVSRHLKLDEIKYIVAVTKDDVSYVQTGNPVYPEDVPLLNEGVKEHIARKAKLFTDRGIYRPGDTLNFKGIIREYSDGKIIAPGIQPIVRINDSKGENILTSPYDLSEFGSLWGQLKLESHLPLGTYSMELVVKDDVLTEHTFELQEFRAPRHFTGISFNKESREVSSIDESGEAGDMLKVTIKGNYYSGGHIKNGQVRWKIFHGPTSYDVKEIKGYKFGDLSEDKFLLESSESILDESGSLDLSFPIDPKVRSGKRSLIVVATTIDFDGRVATTKSIYQEDTPYMVGIKGSVDQIKSGDELPLKILVADSSHNPVNTGDIKVDILRKDWSYIRQRNDDGKVFWRYKSFWKKFLTTTTSLNDGLADFNFNGAMGGDYIFKFSYSEGENTYISGVKCAVEGGYYSYEYMNRNSLYEKLAIWSDKDSYQPTEKALINVKSRKKSSSYLMTVERDGILEHQVLAKKDAKDISFFIPESYSPNVFVSVLGVSPRSHFPAYKRSIDDGAPAYEFGTINIPVAKGAGLLNIGINETEVSLKRKPQSPVTLNISVKNSLGYGKKAELAVGVVDESVLALTAYKTPELKRLIDFTIPLNVGTQDVRRMLVHQTPFSKIRNNPLTGGGGLENSTLEKTTVRTNFNPVAYFNPAVVTDSDGNAQVSFTLPDNITSYRIYVVANDQSSGFGQGERNLIATKDFYVEPGLPRFLTTGDKLKFPVSAFNKTNETMNASFDWQSNEFISFVSEDTTSLINPQDSHRFEVQGEALSTGLGEVVFSGVSEYDSDAVEVKIPIHSGETLGTEILMGSFSNSSRVMLPLPTELLKEHSQELSKSSTISLTVSSSPFIKLTGGLLYLLEYPYGCVEQTSSRVLPLAALRGLIEKDLIPDISLAQTDKYLKAGVSRLLKMQTESGGFGYWPGNKNPHQTGTLYAMAALSIAKENGISIPERSFKKGVKYVSKLISTDNNLNENQIAFASYVLAMNKSLDEDFFKSKYRNISRKGFETRMFWTLAGIKSGFMSEANLYHGLSGGNKWGLASLNSKSVNGVFNAKYRTHAIGLLASHATAPNGKFTHSIAKDLFEGLNPSGRWTSTSDTGWALYALGSYYSTHQSESGSYNVQIRAGSGQDKTITVDNNYKKVELSPDTYFQNPFLDINSNSNSPIYYKAVLKFPRVDYAESGVSKGFYVSKTIENLNGSKEIKVGDLVKVTISIEKDKTSKRQPYRYIVIDDPLPAGLVAINSSIKTEENVPGEAEKESYYTEDGAYVLTPSFQEIRDDRVLIFKDSDIWSGEHQYSYYARATTEGQFILPSTKVQLMYSPQIMGLTPKSLVNIKASQVK